MFRPPTDGRRVAVFVAPRPGLGAPDPSIERALDELLQGSSGLDACVLCLDVGSVRFPLFRKALSLKFASRGEERYCVERREYAVDELNFLILNEGVYSSVVRSPKPIRSVSMFFSTHLATQVVQVLIRGDEHALADPGCEYRQALPSFSQNLKPITRRVSGRVAGLQRGAEMGILDEDWYLERLYDLLAQACRTERCYMKLADRIPRAKVSTRRELFRRLTAARDYIHSNYAAPTSIAEIASAACMSPYQLIRLYRNVFRLTPHQHLTMLRARTAKQLMAESDRPLCEIAREVGLADRSSLYRLVGSRSG